MKKNVFGFLGLLGALLLASCTNPMIASGSSDEPEAPTPVVAVVAHPDTYCVGESALLSATVTNSGNGSVAYQWYKVTGTGDEAESLAIEGAVSSTYISKEERAGDYVYFVKVSNTLGKSIKIVDSDQKKITVKPEALAEASIPSITLTKNKEFYAKGGRVTLVATARTTDKGDLTYKWFCDGTEIPGATESTYIWENADAGEFTFKVEVTNTLNGTNKKADASIEVLVLDEEKVDAERPVFTSSLVAKTYNIGDDVASVQELDGSATVSDGGKLVYQWYIVTSAGDEKINGAGSAKYKPSIEKEGVVEYKVVVTNYNLNASGETAVSASMNVIISVVDPSKENASVPVITSQPESAEYTFGDEASSVTPLSVIANGDGTLSYQWYKNDVVISSATDSTYTPDISEVSENTYYVVVTNSITDNGDGGVKSISVTSEKVTVTVATATVNPLVAATPTVSTSTSPVNYEKNATASAMTVTASVTDGGVLSYQWYKASDATEAGEAINNATSSSCTPETSKAGTTYYYAKVTNTKTNGSKSVTAEKDSGRIVVNVTSEETYAATPVISAQPQSKDYYQGDTATALSVTASVTSEGKALGGNLSYQWYKADSADGEGSPITNATNETYTPEIAAIGSSWYYCIVTNTAESADRDKTATKKSSYAKISVTEFVAKTPSVSISPATVSVKSGDSVTLTASVSGQDEGAVLTYQWKKDGEAIKDETSATYTFSAPSVTEETNFTYTCEVTSTVTKYNATATATGTKTVNVTVAPATGSISIDFN